MSSPEALFAFVVTELSGRPGVTPPSGKIGIKRMFGASVLRVNGKGFAMLSSEKKLVVKLPRERVDSLVVSGYGVRFVPRKNGSLMKEWLVVDQSSKLNWLRIATEALEFVRTSPNLDAMEKSRSPDGRRKRPALAGERGIEIHVTKAYWSKLVDPTSTLRR